MLALDVFCSLQVGNRAAHLQDAVVGTGRKVQPAHGGAELLHARIVEHGILLKKRGGHLCVAVNAFVTFEALLLNLTCPHHTLTYALARLTLRCLGDILERHILHLHLNIDAVHQRTGYFVHIARDLRRCAHTGMSGMMVIAAWARVHGSHHHERARKSERVFRTRHRNHTVFKRLPQRFQHCTRKLGKLVEEKHTIMCQTYLPRHERGSASHQRHIGDGVVWRTERTLTDERRVLLQLACHTVDLRRLQTFTQREGRQDGRKTLRHHGLSTSRTSHQDDVMPAGCGHLKGTFHVLLTFHLRKVIVELQLLLIKLLTRVYHRRLGFFHPVQNVNHLTDVVDTINFQTIDHCRLTRVLHRHKQRFQPHRASLDRNGQCAFHRQYRAVKPQLTDEHILLGFLKIQFFQCHHQANGHREVKTRPFFPHIGRCEVHHRLLHRHVVAVDIQC